MCITELPTPTKQFQSKDYFSSSVFNPTGDDDSYDPIPSNATLDGIPVRKYFTPVFTDDPQVRYNEAIKKAKLTRL
jgi:hypothetical protein